MQQGPVVLLPDRSGPRNVAVILLFGALVLGLTGIDALRQGALEDLPIGQVEMTIETPQQSGDDITVEDYEAFHDLAKERGAYAWRGWSMSVGMGLVAIGAVGLFLLKPWGPQLAVAGFRFQEAAEATLEGLLVETQWQFMLACGASSGLCLAVAALPLLNARARLALFSHADLTEES